LWREAKEAALGTADNRYLFAECSRRVGDSWLYFTNYHADAYRLAVETLHVRTRREGGVTPAVRDWIRGQEAVFTACTDSAAPPEAAPAGAPAWLVRDRAYQSAAWSFYALRYDDAIAGFRRIEQDTESPWRPLAPYLIGRCYLRKGTVTP